MHENIYLGGTFGLKSVLRDTEGIKFPFGRYTNTFTWEDLKFGGAQAIECPGDQVTNGDQVPSANSATECPVPYIF
jgi:hypothetical protein